MDAPREPRIVKAPDVRRREIVETAMRLFLERGYEHTSTTDVMKALQIAKGTIYHYFPSKEALMEAVVDHMADGFVQRRVEAAEAAEGNALVKIEVLFAREHTTEEEAQATEHLHAPDNVKLHARLLAVLVEKMAPPFGDLIQRGCEEDLLRTDHPHEAAELLLAGIQFLTDDGVYPWDDATITRRSLAFPSLAEALLDAPAGSFAWLARTARPPHSSSDHPTDEESRP